MEDKTERMKYFDRQFLHASDFQVEQDYHIDRRQRHNRLLHTYGVAEGLTVSKTNQPGEEKIVLVTSGTAYDRNGREIVLVADTKVNLTGFQGNTAHLTIVYGEKPGEPKQDIGLAIDQDGFTRFKEDPLLELSANPPPANSDKLILAIITTGADGSVNNVNTDPPGKLKAGALPAGSVGMSELNNDVKGRLVTGGNNHNHAPNSGVSQVRHTHLIQDGGTNPHGTTPTDIDGVAGQNRIAAQINAGTGVIDEARLNLQNHDHAGVNSKKINHSDLNLNDGTNPHKTTASDVNALPLGGGLLNGGVTVRLTHTPPPVIGGGIGVIGGAIAIQQATIALRGKVDTPGAPPTFLIGGPSAAVMGDSNAPNVFGVHASAPNGTHALFVQGSANFTGPKTGYVVDNFINASGKRLHTGDVVKLKGSPIVRYRGDDNKIPIAEVTLADKEDDNMVIGIVDREAIPEPDTPDERVEPDDHTFIENGGQLLVVTLGAYAHCKVDATRVPIEVGDLLTSSDNPGYAKKAENPKISSIIGKALEPLKDGTGYIAIFVNIQ